MHFFLLHDSRHVPHTQLFHLRTHPLSNATSARITSFGLFQKWGGNFICVNSHHVTFQPWLGAVGVRGKVPRRGHGVIAKKCSNINDSKIARGDPKNSNRGAGCNYIRITNASGHAPLFECPFQTYSCGGMHVYGRGLVRVR